MANLEPTGSTLPMMADEPVTARSAILEEPSAPSWTAGSEVRRRRVSRRLHARDRATLLLVEGPEHGRMVAVPMDRAFVLGRGPGVDLSLADPTVSRLHARFDVRGDGHHVVDLGSANGTYVNGEVVRHLRPLRPGDRLEIGSRILLRYDRHSQAEQEALLRLYRFAVRDALTGLYDRAYLRDRLEAELSYARRHGGDLAVLMIDLDHFKRVNDAHGHPAGDALLRVVAATMKRLVRPEDVLARFGGEEFAVVARGLDVSNGRILAERLRRAVAALRPRWQGKPLAVSISAGVASLGALDPSGGADDLIEAADEALYCAKRAGRNTTATV
ncbi:MAG: GGDEF domain-containing protein [Myxococcota bacterium]